MSDTATRLRARLAAAADYGRDKIADTSSPCARDLCWHLIQIATADLPDDALPREVKAAETLWKAALEIERYEVGG